MRTKGLGGGNKAWSYYEISKDEIKAEVEQCQLQLGAGGNNSELAEREVQISQRLNRVLNACMSYDDPGVLDSMLVEIQKVIVAFVKVSEDHRYDVLETLTRAALRSEEEDGDGEDGLNLQSRGGKDKDKGKEKKRDSLTGGISTSYVQGLLEEIQRQFFKGDLEDFMRNEGELMMGHGLTLDDIWAKSGAGKKKKKAGDKDGNEDDDDDDDDDDDEFDDQDGVKLTGKEKESQQGGLFSWLFCQMVGSPVDTSKGSFDINTLVATVPPLGVRMRERIIECVEVEHFFEKTSDVRVLVITNERVYLLKRLGTTPFLKEGTAVEKLEGSDR